MGKIDTLGGTPRGSAGGFTYVPTPFGTVFKAKIQRREKPPTEAQIKQNERFKLATEWVKQLNPLLKVVLAVESGRYSPANNFISWNANLIDKDTTDIPISDVSKIKITKGGEFVIPGISTTIATGNEVNITVPNTGLPDTVNTDAQFYAVAYNTASKTFSYTSAVDALRGTAFKITPVGETDDEVHIFVFYMDPVTGRTSESQKVGKLNLK